jgi:hypothetical protein
MCKKIGALVLSAVAAGHHANSVAVTFGESIQVPGGTAIGCSDTTYLLPVPVSVPSRVLVIVTGSVANLDLSHAYSFTASAELRDSADSTTLAITGLAYARIALAPGDYSAKSFGYSMVFPGFSVGTVYTAQPGQYKLKLHLNTAECPGNGTQMGAGGATMTYVLLSSAFDRIFADGFSTIG